MSLQLSELFNLFEVDTEAEWSAAVLKLASQLGFEHTLFGLVTDKALPLESAFLVSNYPEEWRSTYDNQNMHQVDPTVSHCLTSTLPIIWKPETFQGQSQSEFYEQACGYGLRSGISLPMHGTSKEFGVFSFVSNGNDHAANAANMGVMSTMSILRDYALESSRKFIDRSSKQVVTIKLTTCQLECLKWVFAGKSSWEISRILNRSEATINFHIANIMKTFDVLTRQQAVIKAIKMGIITPI
jgi:LuxR family quorum-sensing transcriptional regulator LasR